MRNKIKIAPMEASNTTVVRNNNQLKKLKHREFRVNKVIQNVWGDLWDMKFMMQTSNLLNFAIKILNDKVKQGCGIETEKFQKQKLQF